MRSICSVALALLTGCGASMQPSQDAAIVPLLDGWEVPVERIADMDVCEAIESPLVRPVNPALRGAGVAMLSKASFVEVTDAEAKRLIGAGEQSDTQNASSLVANYLSEARARKHRAVVESRDSWSEADENELASLSTRFENGHFSGYKPYLVRAVAKHEGTGRFYAELCGGDLKIVHGSLGRTTPPSTRVPLVVYLRQQPSRVFATWSMAE